jgi:membrane-associated protease RseP (regulator of RpoE activity)
MNWFYNIAFVAGALLGWPLLSSVALMWMTCHMYAFLKRKTYSMAGLRVTTVWIGVLPVHSTRRVVSGRTYVDGLLPIFPFVDYEDRSADSRVTLAPGRFRWWTAIRAVACNVTVAFSFVWTLAALSFWGWGYPAGRSVVSVRSVTPISEAAQHGVGAGDELVMIGETLITDASQINALASNDAVALFAQQGGFTTMRFDRETQSNMMLESRALTKRLRIREVADNSTAWNAGLREKDVIRGIDNADMFGIDELLVGIRRSIGRSAKFSILRNETEPADVTLRVTSGNRGAIGIVIDAAYELRRRPVVVVDVKPDGPAGKAGVKPGDVIVTVGEQGIAGLSDLHDRVARGLASGASLGVIRGNSMTTVVVRPTLMEASVDMLGASYRESSWGRINAMLAIRAGFEYACYALAVPFQLLGQLASGLADPFGIYGTWSSFLSAGVPSVERGSRSALTWLERTLQGLAWLTAYALSVAVPFMLLIEYFASAKVLVAACGSGAKALLGACIICVAVTCLIAWIATSDWLVNAYEFPAFDRSVLTVRSLWWL